jgi:DNA-binding GntR family transcriptional regulator
VFRALTPSANKGHEEIVDAIAAGDGARAESIMSSHVKLAQSDFVSILNRHLRKLNVR